MVLWQIKLDIEGLLRLDRTYLIKDVTLKNKGSNKLQAVIDVEADNPSVASDVAIRKVNDVLDTLSLMTDSSLIIAGEKQVHQLDSNIHISSLSASYSVSRIINNEEIQNAEEILNNISGEEITFLRAVGWYRKGLNGIDAFDTFLAFWNSIEIITQKFGPSGPEINGSKDKMIQMLNNRLGGNYSDFVREFYEYRNNIAHGAKPVILEQIRLVSSKIPKLKEVANKFLLDYAKSNYLRENNTHNS